MLPYWLLFTVCAAGALEHRRREHRQVQGGPLLIAVAIFAILMIGLRFEVGGDWFSYIEIYEQFRYLDLGEALFQTDPGFSFVNWLAQQIGAGIWFVNTVCASVFVWGLVKFARKQPNPWLVLVVSVPYLIIVVGMGYTRQAVAIGFILAGLAVFDRTRILQFAIYILFAALFHKTSVIIFPLVALSVVTQRIGVAALLLVLGVLLYVTLLRDTIDALMVNYLDAGYESQGAAIRVAMNIVPAIVFLLLRKRFGLAPEVQKLWTILCGAALAALAMLFVLSSSTAVDRLALYLVPVQLFVLSRVPYAFLVNGRPNSQGALAVIAYSAMVQFVWLNYATHADFWVPYNSFIGRESNEAFNRD